MRSLLLTIIGALLISCDNSTSLQEYYVKNQGDTAFMSLDVPTSLVLGENSQLTEEQKATLSTIKKVNFLAFPLKGENQEAYEEEKTKISNILANEKYHSLMKLGKGTTRAEIFFTGEDDAIDEFIVYGFDEERGFGVARVLGDDMKPEDLIKLFRSAEKGDLNLAGLEDLLRSQQ